MSNAPCVHVAPLPSRCLAAVEGSQEKHRFVLGTFDVHALNQVQLLEYSEDRNKLEVIASLQHPSQIHRLVSCKSDESLLISSSSGANGHELSLLKLPEEKLSTSASEQEFSIDPIEFDRSTVLSSSNEQGSLISAVQWHPKKTHLLLTLSRKKLSLCNIKEESFKVTRSACGLSSPCAGAQRAPDGGEGTTVALVQHRGQLGPSLGRRGGGSLRRRVLHCGHAVHAEDPAQGEGPPFRNKVAPNLCIP